MKKLLFTKSTLFLFLISLTFQSVASENYNDFEHPIDSKLCKVEEYKQRGFDFSSVRDEVLTYYGLGNVLNFLKQIKNVKPIRSVLSSSLSLLPPQMDRKKIIDFEYHDDNPSEIVVYRIIQDRSSGKSQSSCKIRTVTLPDPLHGRWVGWIGIVSNNEDTPYRRGTQVMELSKNNLSWSYTSHYLFPLPNAKEEDQSIYCSCRFTGVITSVKTTEDFTRSDMDSFKEKYTEPPIIPDYSLSYRLTNIEFLKDPRDSEKCPELVAEANKRLENKEETDFPDYMKFEKDIFLLEDGRLDMEKKIAFSPNTPNSL